jgi:hypothetical protein
MPAYRLALSKGVVWAIKGATTTVVPKVMADASYNENAATFRHAGSYIIYLPHLDLPDTVDTYLGPLPGMNLIDTDVELSGQ